MIFSKLFAVATALLVPTLLGAPAIISKDLGVDSAIDFSNAISVVPTGPAAGSLSVVSDYAHGYCTCK
jgi:hypothetical protein